AQTVWPDHRVAAFCDCEPFCQAVLEKHWPDTPVYIERFQAPRPQHAALAAADRPTPSASRCRRRKRGRFFWRTTIALIRRRCAALRASWVGAAVSQAGRWSTLGWVPS